MNKNVFFTFAPLVALGLSFVFSIASTPGKSYLSIPAAAFQRQRETFPYYLDAKEIYNPTGQSATFFAPVLLPHGVTVNKVTFYYFDDSSDSGNYGVAVLGRNDNAGNLQSMASITSNDGGSSSNYDDVIEHASIDNSQYSYYLSLYLSTGDVHAYAVVIEYTIPASINLPLITR